MRIPKRLKIGGKTFTVKFDNEEASRHNYDGVVCYHQQIILLRSDAHPERLEECLLHEIVHVIDMGINIKDDSTRLSEGETARLSETLYQVLKDNELTFK